MKRFALVLALVFALAAGFGCAKKQESNPGYVESYMTPELAAAIAKITDARILFAFDKYTIEPEYKAVLQEKAEIMKAFPQIKVRIEGNCDERGTQEYNLALGERRARAAYDYMIQLGVPASSLETISFGKENPAVQGSGEAAWAQNRRDDFRVVSYY